MLKNGLQRGVNPRAMVDACQYHSMLPRFKEYIRNEILTGGEPWEFGKEEPYEDVLDFVRWMEGKAEDEEMPPLEAPPETSGSEDMEEDVRPEKEGVSPEIVTMCTSLMTYLSSNHPDILKLLGSHLVW